MIVERILVLLVVVCATAVVAALLRRYFAGSRVPSRFDRSDVGAPGGKLIVEFSSPYCFECQQALPMLREAATRSSSRLAVVDAKESPRLASKYRIRSTPTILVVDAADRVTASWVGTPDASELHSALAEAS